MRKKTINTSVRYVPQSEQSKEVDVKPKTIKNNSLPCKQNKKINTTK